jgi:arylsulfatase A-like enzyme
MCCPSRASIMTGRYAHNTGVLNNGRARALQHSTTLASQLQEAGYATAIFGKFLNWWPIESKPPFYDQWAINETGASPYKGGTWNVQGTLREVDTYATRYIGMKARQFINSVGSNQSWFMYLSVPNPHYPYTPERRYRHASVGDWDGNPAVLESDRSDKPRYVRDKSFSYQSGAVVRVRQLRTLKSVDDMIDTVMTSLRDEEELANTLVVFVSDNGYLWGDHGLKGKSYPYLHSIRVPMIARWPNHIPAGRINKDLVANIDIAPTVMEAVGLVPEVPMDGRSLLSATGRRQLLTEYWTGRGMRRWTTTPTWASLLTKRGHYIEYYNDDGRPTLREFYNLARDPWELRNLGRPPHREWAQRLRRARSCSGQACP